MNFFKPFVDLFDFWGSPHPRKQDIKSPSRRVKKSSSLPPVKGSKSARLSIALLFALWLRPPPPAGVGLDAWGGARGFLLDALGWLCLPVASAGLFFPSGADPHTPFARSCSQLLIQFFGSAPGLCLPLGCAPRLCRFLAADLLLFVSSSPWRWTAHGPRLGVAFCRELLVALMAPTRPAGAAPLVIPDPPSLVAFSLPPPGGPPIAREAYPPERHLPPSSLRLPSRPFVHTFCHQDGDVICNV